MTVRADQPCTSSAFFSRTCLTIDKPFHVAFVGGRCLDNTHRVVESGCFELSDLANDRLSYFSSQDGIALSAALNGDPAFATSLWNAAGPLGTTSSSYAITLKPGHQFVLDMSPSATQIFESPFSQYTHGLSLRRRRRRACATSAAAAAPPLAPAPTLTPR